MRASCRNLVIFAGRRGNVPVSNRTKMGDEQTSLIENRGANNIQLQETQLSLFFLSQIVSSH